MACPIINIEAEFTEYANPSEFGVSAAMDVAVGLSVETSNYTNLNVTLEIEGQLFTNNNTSVSTPILNSISVNEDVNITISLINSNGNLCEYEATFNADQEIGQDIELEEIYYRTFLQLGSDEQIEGCTDPNAENYNPLATIDDGSCFYCEFTSGCTYPSATNYNSSTNFDDGSCEFPSGVTQVNCNKTENFEFEVNITNTSSLWSITSNLSSSSSYSGNLIGSYKIYGLKNPEILALQPNISSSVATPIVLSDYIEFGFNQLTPSPITNTDSPWWFKFASDANIPNWITGSVIEIKITILTDDNCIYNGTSNITLPSDGNTNSITINLT